MLDFSWERDIDVTVILPIDVFPVNDGLSASQSYTINWRDASKNLVKLHPRIQDDVEDDMPGEPGTFFNYFHHNDDPFDVRRWIFQASWTQWLTRAWLSI